MAQEEEADKQPIVSLPLSVDLDPEEINRQVAQIVTESLVGEKLREAIDTALRGMAYDRNNVIKQTVAQVIDGHIRELILEEYADKIKAAVAERLTDEVLTEIAKAATESLLKQLRGY